eukprot:TRINITY_DN7088_c0_g1_i1.p1 TRINITY_DN7088_c0_g1~~TRINITY_DN7088_c0_g1_i1.p1  ORF type:complete len:193 (+),score=38.79 TRINITY_DN7088_c0_g1_i1:223-801(+)
MAAVAKKLVCIGDGSAGKTCLLTVFANGEFPDKYVPTVFENYVANLDLGETKVELALWDTAGQEDYSHIRPLSYQDAHVFLICFAVDNRDSFDNVENKWVPEMKQYCPKVPYVVVGCKTDLRNDDAAQANVASKNQTMVTKAEATTMAGKVGAYTYEECSAKDGDNVKGVFEKAAEAALTTKTSGGGCCLLM